MWPQHNSRRPRCFILCLPAAPRPALPLSRAARHLWNFDELLEKIWQYVGMVRIYTKPRGQIPDYNSPVILHQDTRMVEDFCEKIHKSIIKQFKYAWVWGASVKHQPQRVGKEHTLEDEDVVQVRQPARCSAWHRFVIKRLRPTHRAS